MRVARKDLLVGMLPAAVLGMQGCAVRTISHSPLAGASKHHGHAEADRCVTGARRVTVGSPADVSLGGLQNFEEVHDGLTLTAGSAAVMGKQGTGKSTDRGAGGG